MKIHDILQKIFRKNRNTEEYNIDYQNIKTILKNDKEAILIDVRSPQEYKEGHLEGSINIPLYILERNEKEIENKKNNTIILYCQSGNRSKKAMEILKQNGYNSLYQLEGGLDNI